MRAFQHALDPDSADAAAVRRYDRAGVTFCATLDGTVSISGSADPVSGSLLATAVDTAAPLVAGDTRTAARRRLDGLADICRAYLAHPDTGRAGRGGHPHLIVTLDADTLAAEPAATALPLPGPAAGTRNTPRPPRTPRTQTISRTQRSRTRRRGRDAAGAAAARARARAMRLRVGRRVARCPGSAGSPGPPPAGSAATRTPPTSPSAPTGSVDRGRQWSAVLHRRPTPGDDRPRRRPLPRPVLRPADRLGRRPPPGAGRPARPDHRRERGAALPRPPPAAARRTLAAAPATRRPLPAAPPGNREDHRPRTPPTRPQQTATTRQHSRRRVPRQVRCRRRNPRGAMEGAPSERALQLRTAAEGRSRRRGRAASGR